MKVEGSYGTNAGGTITFQGDVHQGKVVVFAINECGNLVYSGFCQQNEYPVTVAYVQSLVDKKLSHK